MLGHQVLRFLFLCVSVTCALAQDSSYFRFLPTHSQPQQQQQPQLSPPPPPQQPQFNGFPGGNFASPQLSGQFYGFPGGNFASPQLTQGPAGFPPYFGPNFPYQPSPAGYGQQFHPGFGAPQPFFPFSPAFNPQDYYQTLSNVYGGVLPNQTGVPASGNGTSAATEVAQPAVIETVTPNTTEHEVNVSATPPLIQPPYGPQFFPGSAGSFPVPQPTYPPLPYSPVFNHEEFLRSFHNILGNVIPNQTNFITGTLPGVHNIPVNGTQPTANVTVTTVLTGTETAAGTESESTDPARPGVTRTVLVDRFPNYSMYFRRPTQNAGLDFGRPINYQFVYSSQLRGMNDISQGGRTPTSDNLPTIPGLPAHSPTPAGQPPAIPAHPQPAPGIPALPNSAGQLPAIPAQPQPAPGFPIHPAFAVPPFSFPFPSSPTAGPPGFAPFPHLFAGQPPLTAVQPPAIAAQPTLGASLPPASVVEHPATAAHSPADAAQTPSAAAQPPAAESQPSAAVVKPAANEDKKPIIAASSVVVVRKVVKIPKSAVAEIVTSSAAADTITPISAISSADTTPPPSKEE